MSGHDKIKAHKKRSIPISLIHRGETHRIQTYTNEYYSLMTLISDQLAIPGFGLCCGMGSCGTCRVDISYNNGQYRRPVLACSIQVNDDLANTTIIIPDAIW